MRKIRRLKYQTEIIRKYASPIFCAFYGYKQKWNTPQTHLFIVGLSGFGGQDTRDQHFKLLLTTTGRDK